MAYRTVKLSSCHLSVCFTTQNVEVLGSLGFKWLSNPMQLEFKLFVINKEASWTCQRGHVAYCALAVPFQFRTSLCVSPGHRESACQNPDCLR